MARVATAQFVGRSAELLALRQLSERMVEGAGGIVLIGGEPGIGKSRLASEVADDVAAAGCNLAWGHCRESESAPPLWPWLQILRQLRMRPPRLEQFADVHARFAYFEQITDMVRTAADPAPLLLVLDDLHRADDSSLRLLSYLADQLWPASIGMIAIYRDTDLLPRSRAAEVIDDLRRIPFAAHLALRGLDQAEIETWLVSVDGRALGVDAAELHERTGGNPLFVDEVIRLVAERHSTERHSTELGSTERGSTAVPATVSGVIAERVARLPDATRAALEVGSVIGRDFGYAAVAAALEVSPMAALTMIEPAVDARIVVSVRNPSADFRFAHTLIGQAIEARLGVVRRTELHHKVFTALRDTGMGVPGDLAHHAMIARPLLDDATVAHAVQRAAADADGHLAWEDAARWWAITVELCEPGTTFGGVDIELRLARSMLLGGAVDRARHCFERIAARAAVTGDDVLLADGALGVGDTVAEVSPDLALLDLLDHAIVRRAVPLDVRARLEARRAMATYWLPGQQPQARRRSSLALRIAEQSSDSRAIGAALVAKQFTLRGPDLLVERIAAGEAALDAADRVDDDDLRFRARQWLIPDKFQAGDLDGAVTTLEEARRIAAVTRSPLHRWWVLIYRALLVGFRGDLDEAEALTEAAYALGTRLGQAAAEPYRLGTLTRIRWQTGQLGELTDQLHRAVGKFPGLPTLRADLALVLAVAGRRAESTDVAEGLITGRFAALPRDSLFVASLGILSEAAVSCRNRGHARRLVDALEPFAERNLIQGVPVGWGAGAWHLARLYSLLGDKSAAASRSALAQRLHTRWGASGFGLPLSYMPAPAAPAGLSPRELEVIRHVADGLPNKEIAAALHVSVHTVERHVANIFVKTSARNRADATAWAHRRGLVASRFDERTT